ncbi:MAG: hypothetical protein JW810_14490, partial [Sedimentisphaerales bacterium]|nr:hypothetical protein [Sedimentisphaerales bacterium]
MIESIAAQAKKASIHTAALAAAVKDGALAEVARALTARQEDIVQANRQDLAQAERDNLAGPLLKRLKFDQAKIAESVAGIESVRRLPDPVGRTLRSL